MDLELQTQLKGQLLARKAELSQTEAVADDAAAPVTLDQSSVGRLSRMDAMQQQAMALETQRRHRAELRRIELALQKIEQDEYGWCDECDEAIDIRRLRYDPSASYCIVCAQKMES